MYSTKQIIIANTFVIINRHRWKCVIGIKLYCCWVVFFLFPVDKQYVYFTNCEWSEIVEEVQCQVIPSEWLWMFFGDIKWSSFRGSCKILHWVLNYIQDIYTPRRILLSDVCLCSHSSVCLPVNSTWTGDIWPKHSYYNNVLKTQKKKKH